MRSNIAACSIFLTLAFFHCSPESPENEKEESAILPDPYNGGITLPPDFGATIVADSLGRGRHLTVRDNGDIYVHLRKLTDGGHGIVALRDTTGNGKADRLQGFSEVTGTGIEIHKNHLYYSSRTQVLRSPLLPDALTPANTADTLIQLVEGSGHMEKPFTFDGQGNIYVNVGSFSNACQVEKRTKGSPGFDPCEELETRAGIWRFKDEAEGQIQDLSLRYATGIRNAVALEWNTEVHALFAVQHGRDDLHRFWPEHFTEIQNVELPSEEFFQVNEGDDFGWPYCYHDPFRKAKYLNPEYGGDGEKIERCATAKMPLIGFPGHWGPNDILFYRGDQFPERYKNGAFIAFHGSWNRLNHDQAGFNVIFVPMEGGKPSGVWEVFADGFVGPAPVTNPGNARFRPCGLAEGPDGSLYIVDSQVGRVWRIMYYPEGLPEMAVEPVVAEKAEEEETIAPELAAGKLVYDAYCKACHMDNGKGVPGMNPPLVETDWVLGDKTRLIKVVLNGLSDPIEINGEIYQNAMASFSFLSDQQIADVLTYIRQSFGNDAEAVSIAEVKEVRAGNE